MTYWPYYPSTVQTPYTISWPAPALTCSDLDRIRELVREEVHKALYPEESRPSATVECEIHEKRYKGTVYLVEDEDEAQDDE